MNRIPDFARYIVAIGGLALIACLWWMVGEQAPEKKAARGDASAIGRAAR